MEQIFSDLFKNLELLNDQGLQALKEFKEKNPNWDDKQENKYKKIEKINSLSVLLDDLSLQSLINHSLVM